MRKLMITTAAALVLLAAPRLATAGVDVSIGIGLPLPRIFVAPAPPVVYGPPVRYRRAYGPPVYVQAYPGRHHRSDWD